MREHNEFDLDLPDRFQSNKDFYTIITLAIIPLMVIAGLLFYSSMLYGGLVLSALSSMMYIDVIISQSEMNEREKSRTCYYSALIVFLTAWLPSLFLIGTPYLEYSFGYTAIWLSLGLFSIVKKYSWWREFWKGGSISSKSDKSEKNKKGDYNGR